MDVVVQIPAFQEGPRLTDTAEMIVEQNTPGWIDVDVEAWVTLSPPDRSLCTTWQAAMDARDVDTFEAPIGKLSARNAAHDDAVDRGYDVIVSWDADAPPLHGEVLHALLSPFEQDDRVVATNSRPVSAIRPSVIDRLIDVTGAIDDRLRPHIHGQCAAFTTSAWEDVGPFDESVGQSNISSVRAVEEFDFYRKLSQLGRVEYRGSAVVYNDPRRHYCKMPFMGDPSYCSRRTSGLTFGPKR